MSTSIDPAQIAAQRKLKRDNSQLEHRSTMALEDIADTLEAIRVILLTINNALGGLKH